MKLICSYCRDNYGEKGPLNDDRVSHGMCDECYAYFQRQLAGLPLNEYLDDFESPILIVNQDGRIAAANEMAMGMLGKPEREITGLLGGEALECSYARLPGGCGNTIHCETCTIRKTVMHTMQTRSAMKKVHVKLMRDRAELEMTISTRYIDGLVQIVIEK